MLAAQILHTTPASACLRNLTICSSANLDFFMSVSLREYVTDAAGGAAAEIGLSLACAAALMGLGVPIGVVAGAGFALYRQIQLTPDNCSSPANGSPTRNAGPACCAALVPQKDRHLDYRLRLDAPTVQRFGLQGREGVKRGGWPRREEKLAA